MVFKELINLFLKIKKIPTPGSKIINKIKLNLLTDFACAQKKLSQQTGI